MRFSEEKPAVADSHRGSVDVGVDDDVFLVAFGGVRIAEGCAFEAAMFALPDLRGVVHALRSGFKGQSLPQLFACGPCALAETPVVVVFARTTIHHLI